MGAQARVLVGDRAQVRAGLEQDRGELELGVEQLAVVGVDEPRADDLAAGQVRKNGLKIRVQELPFRILCLLLERPGEVVTREELREKLWAEDTFVDFENSLNTAVNKLRTALNDDASVPRYIETIPRRGYRFIGTTEPPRLEPVTPAPPPVPRSRRRLALLVAVCSLAIFVLVNGLLRSRNPRADEQRPVRRFALSPEDNLVDALISPDGRRVAYLTGPPARLWIQDLDQDEPRQIAGPEHHLGVLFAWSRDGQSLAFHAGGHLVKVPADGGLPVVACRSPGSCARRHEATGWSMDGGLILLRPGPPLSVFEAVAQAEEQTNPSNGEANAGDFSPRYLPARSGSRRIVFQENRSGKDWIVGLDLDSRRREALAEGERPFYSPAGYVLYENSGSVWALRFSPGSMKRLGEPTSVASRAMSASISRDGTLAYIDPGDQLQQMD